MYFGIRVIVIFMIMYSGLRAIIMIYNHVFWPPGHNNESHNHVFWPPGHNNKSTIMYSGLRVIIINLASRLGLSMIVVPRSGRIIVVPRSGRIMIVVPRSSRIMIVV
eukprot:SAG11_NODE_10415_length_833_cov_2.204360_1_plen_106_part_10